MYLTITIFYNTGGRHASENWAGMSYGDIVILNDGLHCESWKIQFTKPSS